MVPLIPFFLSYFLISNICLLTCWNMTDALLTNLDEGKSKRVVYLDLKKAFDTVDHMILIVRPKAAGVSGLTFNWFHSYLTCCCQRTAVGCSLSGTWRMTVGVPQGSILGPLLFLMYINDVHKSLSHASIALFADYAGLYFSSSSLEDLQFKLNLDLKNVVHWLEKNKVTLNTLKSKFMLIADSKKLKDTCHFRLTVNDCVLERETTFTYLGIVFYEKLS